MPGRLLWPANNLYFHLLFLSEDDAYDVIEVFKFELVDLRWLDSAKRCLLTIIFYRQCIIQ